MKGVSSGFNLVVKRLTEKQLIESDPHPVAPNIGRRLTVDGWAEYERLRHDVVESKTVFMAMSLGNAALSKIVTEFLS